MRIAAVAVVMVTTLSTLVAPANAHEPGFSSVRVEVLDDTVEVHASVPLDLLAVSTDLPLIDDPENAVTRYGSEIAKYFEAHITIRSGDGPEWASEASDLIVTVLVDDDHLDAVVALTPPNGVIGDFDLLYDVIIDHDDDHEVLVGVVKPSEGSLSGATLSAGHNELTVFSDGSSASSSNAFLDVVKLGFEHVVEGLDHILFLVVLVLPAPLVVGPDHRWGGISSIGAMFGHVLGVSTAFLVGHSVTLALATLDWVSAPARPVEVLIALSIAVGAVHAMRPLVRRGEVLIAGIFGLVHGLAFAEILDSLALDGTSKLSNLLAFNIGVELAQLAAILLVLPGLYLLSRTSFYSPFRIGGAAISLVAAIGWIGERLELFANPLGPVETAIIEHPLVVVAVFTLVSLALWAQGRQGQSDIAT